jgi:uncharacterized protein YqgC (DUF456 family)
VIPVIPVAALEWAIALIFAALTQFERTTPAALVIMTVCMLVGATAAWWTPLIGLRGKQMSCWGLVAFFVGLIVGGFVIPLPILGSIIGGIGAVMLVEFARLRDAQRALHSGGAALKTILYGLVIEFLCAVIIVITFLVSLLTT